MIHDHPDTGPVVDWLKGLLDGLWAMVTKLLGIIASGVQEVRADVAGIGHDIRLVFWLVLAVLVLMTLAHLATAVASWWPKKNGP